jgi:ABC-type phosphate transport system ATPase subunit
MNIKATAVFKSIELRTQVIVVFMALNDCSHSAVDNVTFSLTIDGVWVRS